MFVGTAAPDPSADAPSPPPSSSSYIARPMDFDDSYLDTAKKSPPASPEGVSWDLRMMAGIAESPNMGPSDAPCNTSLLGSLDDVLGSPGLSSTGRSFETPPPGSAGGSFTRVSAKGSPILAMMAAAARASPGSQTSTPPGSVRSHADRASANPPTGDPEDVPFGDDIQFEFTVEETAQAAPSYDSNAPAEVDGGVAQSARSRSDSTTSLQSAGRGSFGVTPPGVRSSTSPLLASLNPFRPASRTDFPEVPPPLQLPQSIGRQAAAGPLGAIDIGVSTVVEEPDSAERIRQRAQSLSTLLSGLGAGDKPENICSAQEDVSHLLVQLSRFKSIDLGVQQEVGG